MATITVRAEDQGSHWYGITDDGAVIPVYDWPAKKGGMRSVTVRDARAVEESSADYNGRKVVRLMPSVTTVMEAYKGMGLVRYIKKQYAMAGRITPVTEGESDDEWFYKACLNADRDRDNASEIGTQVHEAIEHLISKGPVSPAIYPYIEPIDKMLAKSKFNVIGMETCVCDADHTYAGRVDLIIEWGGRNRYPGIIDWKTQRTKPGNKFKHYETNGAQLAAYANARFSGSHVHDMNHLILANGMISSTEPGRFEMFKWLDEPRWEYGELLAFFQRALLNWKFLKNF